MSTRMLRRDEVRGGGVEEEHREDECARGERRVDRGGGTVGRGGEGARGAQHRRCQRLGKAPKTGASHLSSFRPLIQSKTPRFDKVGEHFAIWSSTFQAHLSSRVAYMFCKQLSP